MNRHEKWSKAFDWFAREALIWRKTGWDSRGDGANAANERMQLTWLLGAPGRAVSVHWLVVGRYGLGSAATQLMRAVRLPPPGSEAELMYRKCRRELVAGESCRSERSAG